MWLCRFLRASGYVWTFSTRLCGRIALVSGFFLRSGDYALEDRIHRAMDPSSFLERIWTWRSVPFGVSRCASVPRIFVPFCKIDLDFGGSFSWNMQPDCLGNRTFTTAFLRLLVRLTVKPLSLIRRKLQAFFWYTALLLFIGSILIVSFQR